MSLPYRNETPIATMTSAISTWKEQRIMNGKALRTPSTELVRTASRLGSKPSDPMVTVKMMVVMTRLITLAEFRTSYRNPAHHLHTPPLPVRRPRPHGQHHLTDPFNLS